MLLLAVVLAMAVLAADVVGLASLVLVDFSERLDELIADGAACVTLVDDCVLVVNRVVVVVSLETTVIGLLVVVVAVIPPEDVVPVFAPVAVVVGFETVVVTD